ncbi:MAG: hypothetical protein IJ111_02585 [Eggerthellaceae bacterium]|nr:hypothetical protein [Eggerthellaceae bacterium]
MAATLIVGLGGMGQKVVKRISKMIDREGLSNVELVVMDTDVNDLRDTKENFPRIFTVQTSPRGTVGGALDQNPYARDLWFPVNDGLTGKPFTEGAGQVRAVSRLALDHAIEQGYMSELEKAIEKLHNLSGETMRQEMRIMLVGSNNGGTGSGLVLPVAMFIRNFLITRYQDNSAIIRGFFLEPDTIFDLIVDEEERNSLRCNAYATIREIDAFFRKEYAGEGDEFKHVVFNAPQPGSGERVDYPNILPYHFVFLMDAINSEGEHLPSHDAYLQHAAETIYAQALSAVSARSNSSEDNIIRNLAANNGRSRYCGAGSSFLEYPVDQVQRYIGLRWAADNISQEWLELDTQYERMRRDDDELKIADYYSSTFKSLMDGVPFYKKIGRRVYTEYEGEGGRIMREWPADEFPDAVMTRAENVIESELGRQCSDMQHAIAQFEEAAIQTTNEGIEMVADDSDDPVSELTAQYERFYEVARRYNAAIDNEVETAASRIAAATYLVSDFNSNPLESNSSPWQIESLLRIEDGSGVGAIHPGAVRYMLYQSSLNLAEEIEDCESNIASAKSAIKSFIDLQDRQDDAAEEVEDDGKKGKKGKRKIKLSLPWQGGASLDESTISLMLGQADGLTRFKKNIDKRLEFTVKKAFLVEAKKYVDALSDAFEGFYSYLGQQIDNLTTEADSIENDPRYKNDVEGQTHRYVCASTRCLQGLKDECPVKGDTSELPFELCGRIYNSLLAFTKVNKTERSNEVKNQAFKDIFNETIVDYWVERVMDPTQGYPLVVDKNVAQAIAAEAVYLHDGPFSGKDEQASYVNSYLRTVFDQTFHLAAPFIEPPVGETPRTFKTCAYSESILDNAGGYAEALTEKLAQYNATKLPSREYSKYSIMFYRSMYGFCATNLPKYAPAHGGMQPMPEGEYHHAYFMLVNQLSPNLKENKLITPHIDKNWHLVEALPDLNEEHEALIREEIVHAYLFGLIYQQFKARQISTGDDVYYLTSTARQKETHLWVSNGTPCDRFYEVYDAMKFNPRAVKKLISRSAEELTRERNNTVGLSIESCKLLKNVRSEAFKRSWNDDAVKEAARLIIADILSLKERDADAASKPAHRLDTALVTDFFGLGDEEVDNFGWDFGVDEEQPAAPAGDRARRSILEIPVYYRISLPQSETRSGEIDTMIESIFSIVRAHLANFTSSDDLDDQSGQFFEEQYLLFERNLVSVERAFPGIGTNGVVNTIREKTLSFLEPVDSRFERMKKVQVGIEKAWRSIR